MLKKILFYVSERKKAFIVQRHYFFFGRVTFQEDINNTFANEFVLPYYPFKSLLSPTCAQYTPHCTLLQNSTKLNWAFPKNGCAFVNNKSTFKK